jgi:hypothetical protein
MGKFLIKIPVNADGTFDVQAQQQIADSFMGAGRKKDSLMEIKERLDGIFKRYIASSGMLK